MSDQEPIEIATGAGASPNRPAVAIRRGDPALPLVIRVDGLDEMEVHPIHGELIIAETTDRDGHLLHRELCCPECGTGAGLIHREWVYSTRRVDAELRPVVVDGTERLVVGVTGVSEEPGGRDVTGLATPFLCLLCLRGWTAPPNVEIDWR